VLDEVVANVPVCLRASHQRHQRERRRPVLLWVINLHIIHGACVCRPARLWASTASQQLPCGRLSIWYTSMQTCHKPQLALWRHGKGELCYMFSSRAVPVTTGLRAVETGSAATMSPITHGNPWEPMGTASQACAANRKRARRNCCAHGLPVCLLCVHSLGEWIETLTGLTLFKHELKTLVWPCGAHASRASSLLHVHAHVQLL
jgi:hypothetical protein